MALHVSSAEQAEPTLTPQTNGFSLENILGDNHESVEHHGAVTTDAPGEGWDEEVLEDAAVPEGFCVECEGICLFCPHKRH
jgi:hypothetical protein